MFETEDARWAHLLALDEELLHGGVMLSEWCSFIVCEADLAFAKGAYLACILTTVSALETHLRAESERRTLRLVQLIDAFRCSPELRLQLHRLRKYRNGWVHVDEPLDDSAVLENPQALASELQEMAIFAVGVLRRVLYSEQFV